MTGLVTANLALLAGAPTGTLQLRRLIRQLGVTGRLSLPDVNSSTDEVWLDTTFGQVFTLEYGSNLPAPKRSGTGEFPVYGSNGVVGSHVECCVTAPCLVVGRKGSAGAVNLCEHPGCWVTDVAYFCEPPAIVALRFAYLLFLTLGLDELGKGIKPGLSRSEAYVLPVRIPPLAEQHRIVAKVDELMALCGRLEARQQDADAAHAQLVQALLDSLTQARDADEFRASWQRLAGEFDVLIKTDESVDRLRQTLLQLAVMGRLVSQKPTDEPANQLMKRLRASRALWFRKFGADDPEVRATHRKLSELKSTAPPFELPIGWIAVALLDCCRYLVDCHNKTAPYASEGVPIIRTSNVRDRCFRMDDVRYVTTETYAFWSRRCPPLPGDIIFTREAPMGEAAIIPDGATYCLGQRTMLVRPEHEFIDTQYLLIALTEPHLLERASDQAIGSTVKHLRVGDVERLAIPLPPLAEQHRIVAKVTELLALCDQLKARIVAARAKHAQLAEALVAQAVAA